MRPQRGSQVSKVFHVVWSHSLATVTLARPRKWGCWTPESTKLVTWPVGGGNRRSSGRAAIAAAHPTYLLDFRQPYSIGFHHNLKCRSAVPCCNTDFLFRSIEPRFNIEDCHDRPTGLLHQRRKSAAYSRRGRLEQGGPGHLGLSRCHDGGAAFRRAHAGDDRAEDRQARRGELLH